MSLAISQLFPFSNSMPTRKIYSPAVQAELDAAYRDLILASTRSARIEAVETMERIKTKHEEEMRIADAKRLAAILQQADRARAAAASHAA